MENNATNNNNNNVAYNPPLPTTNTPTATATTITTTSDNTLYCHHCRQKRPENIVKPCMNPVDPKGVPCTKRYCKLCFDRFYPGLYDKVCNSNTWVCPYCSSYCCCTRCNNKKYPSYPPDAYASMDWEFENGLTGESAVPTFSYSHKDDKKEPFQRTSMMATNKVPYRSPKKRVKTSESSESDPAWAELSLKYLQYAKKLATHSNIPVANVRQLPSITHMIAISPDVGIIDEAPWRWCDAYHAIKYLKDHSMVTTSRGAKGTSIKEEHETVDDLILQLQLQTSEVNQQGEIKHKKVPQSHHHSHHHHSRAKVHVAVERMPGKTEPIEFNMQIGDVSSESELYDRIKMLLGAGMAGEGSAIHPDVPSLCGDALKLKLLGYAEKESGDYIHANMYTSIPELIEDANEIRVAVV